MQKQLMMALGLALCFGSGSRAGTPLSPQLLGLVDGILSYCTNIDPRDESKYRKLHQAVTAGMNDRDSDKAEKTADYRMSFEMIQGTFRQMPRDSAMRLCTDAIK